MATSAPRGHSCRRWCHTQASSLSPAGLSPTGSRACWSASTRADASRTRARTSDAEIRSAMGEEAVADSDEAGEKVDDDRQQEQDQQAVAGRAHHAYAEVPTDVGEVERGADREPQEGHPVEPVDQPQAPDGELGIDLAAR